MRHKHALWLIAGMVLGLGLARGAGDLLGQVKAADEKYAAGDTQAAFSSYRMVLKDALDATELSEQDRYAAACAAISLAAGTFGDLAQNATDAQIKSNSAEWAKSAQSMIGARFVKAISHGAQVDIREHLTAGKTTIVDFWSKYCPPCEALRPLLEQLAMARSKELAVVKVDINRPGVQGIDWQSPVAQQYGLQSIPHIKIFGPDGRLVAEGDQARQMVMQWLQQAGIR